MEGSLFCIPGPAAAGRSSFSFVHRTRLFRHSGDEVSVLKAADWLTQTLFYEFLIDPDSL
jgi:hypothetical protein